MILTLFNCLYYRKLCSVLTTRILKFLSEKSRKDTESYNAFYKDYSILLKEGVVGTQDQKEKVIN